VGLRRYPARRSKSKILDHFRAVGAIEFGLDWFCADHEAIHTRIPPFSISPLLYYPPIHPSYSPFPLDNHFSSATHISTCILSVFISHKRVKRNELSVAAFVSPFQARSIFVLTMSNYGSASGDRTRRWVVEDTIYSCRSTVRLCSSWRKLLASRGCSKPHQSAGKLA
jgi:hypothetical protein